MSELDNIRRRRAERQAAAAESARQEHRSHVAIRKAEAELRAIDGDSRSPAEGSPSATPGGGVLLDHNGRSPLDVHTPRGVSVSTRSDDAFAVALRRRAQILDQVGQSTGLAPFNREVRAVLEWAFEQLSVGGTAGEAVSAENARRAECLAKVRNDRSNALRAAIHRAADYVLPVRVRDDVPRASWPRKVREWLQDRHESVGLKTCPCWETVRDALMTWEPQTRRLVSPLGEW